MMCVLWPAQPSEMTWLFFFFLIQHRGVNLLQLWRSCLWRWKSIFLQCSTAQLQLDNLSWTNICGLKVQMSLRVAPGSTKVTFHREAVLWWSLGMTWWMSDPQEGAERQMLNSCADLLNWSKTSTWVIKSHLEQSIKSLCSCTQRNYTRL